MKTITDLRNKLCSIFEKLEAKTIEPKIAAEMNNSAGKILGTVKVQLEYATLCHKKPSIPFLK